MPLKRISETLAQLGWLNGSLYLAHRALSRLSAERARIVRYYLVAQPIGADSMPALAPSSNSPVHFIDAAHPLVAAFPRPPAVIARRFAQHDQCLLAQSGGRFAGFLWIARGHYEEDEVRCRYELARPDLSVWDYDVYVEPEFRLGRSFARLWSTANASLREQGVRWTFSRISAFNPNSLKAHRHLDLRLLFGATFICLGPLQIMIAGAAPYLHVSLGAASRPSLRLDTPADA